MGAKVWESAGGFAPTVGHPRRRARPHPRHGEPVRPVASWAAASRWPSWPRSTASVWPTWCFFPWPTKLKRKLGLEQERKTLIAEGVLSIQAGLNPRVLEEKLQAYAGGHAGHAPAKK